MGEAAKDEPLTLVSGKLTCRGDVTHLRLLSEARALDAVLVSKRSLG